MSKLPHKKFKICPICKENPIFNPQYTNCYECFKKVPKFKPLDIDNIEFLSDSDEEIVKVKKTK